MKEQEIIIKYNKYKIKYTTLLFSPRLYTLLATIRKEKGGNFIEDNFVLITTLYAL